MNNENEKGEMKKEKCPNTTRYALDLRERFLKFSVRIISLTSDLPKTPAGYAVANQLVRSATSIGANCEEAQDALSRADFLRTINIALKEARETWYWLRVIAASKLVPEPLVLADLHEIQEIVAMLRTSVRTLKNEK